MRKINNLVKRYENLTELENTTSEDFLGASSFYLLNDGRYLNTEAYDNMRANDHRIIFGATKINPYEIIRIVPESNYIMIDNKQNITYEQQKEINNLIDNYGFNMEYYID